MTSKFKIGFVTCLFILTELTANAQGQAVCTGSKSRYGIKGDPGSTFVWSPPLGTNILNTYGVGDSIDILWGNIPGMYNLSVTENTALGCSVTENININVVSAPGLNLGGNKDICLGQTITLTADTGFVKYMWDNGSSSISINVGDTGYHKVTAYNNIGCIIRDSVYITAHNKPDVTITSTDVAINSNKTFGLCADSVGLTVANMTDIVQLLWNNETNANIYYVKSPNQIVTVAGSSEYGCVGKDSVTVIVCNYKVNLIIPNAITPGESNNNSWKLTQIIQRYPNATVEIFDRWGRQVFKSKDISDNWDGTYKGKPLPMDSYYYIIDLKNGTPPITGNIAIIR